MPLLSKLRFICNPVQQHHLLISVCSYQKMLAVGWLLGQRKRVEATNDPYESGIVSVGSAQLKISVEFYLVAMFFVIFDLEAIFIFAYAVAFFELGWEGYISMMIFIGVLAIALVYGWLSGGLDWGAKKRIGLTEALEREEGQP